MKNIHAPFRRLATILGVICPLFSAFADPQGNGDFGTRSIDGGYWRQKFTLQNEESFPVNLTGNPVVQITGAGAGDFTLVEAPEETIPPGGTTRFTIEFRPSQTGSRSATLSIPTDSPETGVFTIGLSGSGEHRPLQVIDTGNIESSPGSGTIESSVVFEDVELNLTGNLVIQGDLRFSGNATIALNGHDLEVEGSLFLNKPLTHSNTASLTVGEHLFLSSGCLNLDGGLVAITGDLIHSGGCIDLREGRLEVDGDYLIQGDTDSDGTPDSFSSGYICMKNEEDYIMVRGDFVMDSFLEHDNDGPGFLKKGTLEVRGNFTQMSTSSNNSADDNFDAEDDHRVLLSGTSPQTVSFEDPSSCKFSVLELTNPAGVDFPTGLNAVTLTGSGGVVDLSAPLLVESSDFTLAPGVGYDFPGVIHNDRTFDLNGESIVIDGDYHLNGGCLDLAGGTLVITGNLIHDGGCIDLHRGRLEVNGDYLIQGDSDGDGTPDTFSRGYIRMEEEEDYILVRGDFVMDSYLKHDKDGPGILKKGTLEVRGNFTQMSTSSINTADDNFDAEDDHRVLLSGTSPQTVSFEDPSTCKFNILELTNPVGVDFPNGLNAVTITGSGAVVDLSVPLLVESLDFTLAPGVSYDFPGVIHNARTFDLNGESIVIDGDYHLNGGNLDLAGGNLIITGNLIHGGGYIDLHGGRLEVNGDYLIQGDSDGDGTPDTFSGGYIRMNNEEDYVLVHGDFVMDSFLEHDKDGAGYLKEGTLEVRGNFTQMSTSSNNSAEKNFDANTNHHVLLSGTSPQTVSFEDPVSCTFNILELTNPAGVDFPTGLNAVTLTGSGAVLDLSSPLVLESSDFTLAPGVSYHFPGVIHNARTFNLNGESIVIDGDYHLNGGNLDLAGGTLVITGNLIHGGGYIDLHGGHLEVNGDYLIQGDSDGDGTPDTFSSGYIRMRNVGDYILVRGDFVMDSFLEHDKDGTGYLMEGTLEVRGNFTQMSTSSNNTADDNFDANVNHHVLLSGTSPQTVSFEDPFSGTFNILELTNPAGVDFPTGMNVVTLTGSGGVIDLSAPLLLESRDFTLAPGVSYHFPGVIHNDRTFNLNGESIVIDGDYHLNGGCLDLAGGTLVITGNLIHGGGCVDLNGGRLEVNGDYLIQGDSDGDGTPDSFSRGYIRMENEEDYILVRGDFVMDSEAGHQSSTNGDDPGDLSEGTLEVRGNFTQMSTSSSNHADNNFGPYNNHRVLLSGTSPQTISFEDPTGSYFNILELDNPAGFEFLSDPGVSRLFNHRQNPFALSPDHVDTDFADFDGDGIRDHLDPFPVNPDQSILDNCTDYAQWAGFHSTGQPAQIAASLADAANDTDRDRISNLMEFLTGSNPNSLNRLPIQTSRFPDGMAETYVVDLVAVKAASTGLSIQFQSSLTLAPGDWVTESVQPIILWDDGLRQGLRFSKVHGHWNHTLRSSFDSSFQNLHRHPRNPMLGPRNLIHLP